MSDTMIEAWLIADFIEVLKAAHWAPASAIAPAT